MLIMRAVFSAAVFSYIAETFPGARELWQRVGKPLKPVIVLVLAMGLPFLIAFGKCYLPMLPVNVACPATYVDIGQLIIVGGAALVASQAAFFGYADAAGKRLE